jgi:hypothetical protein
MVKVSLIRMQTSFFMFIDSHAYKFLGDLRILEILSMQENLSEIKQIIISRMIFPSINSIIYLYY